MVRRDGIREWSDGVSGCCDEVNEWSDGVRKGRDGVNEIPKRIG